MSLSLALIASRFSSRTRARGAEKIPESSEARGFDSIRADRRSPNAKKPDESSRILRAAQPTPNQRHWWFGNDRDKNIIVQSRSKEN
jgi:hypothetical protein